MTPPSRDEARERLEKDLANDEREYPGLSFVLVFRDDVRALLSPEQGWREDLENAPQDQTLLGIVDDQIRFIRWGKTSHVPFYGWCLADQGAEDFDLCKPSWWLPVTYLPAPPTKGGE